MDTAIHAEGLRKSYGEVEALRGVDLTVPAGAVHALLGPNGAGKTTTVRILSTLLPPDGGRAVVAGWDVVAEPAEVRGRIGLAGQHVAIDPLLTARENLVVGGRLHRLGRSGARRRAGDLLERFDLAADGDRPSRTLSGGRRRRLDLAMSMIVDPVVLFLDEPTTGLDPISRLGLWETIRELAAGGCSVLLTTQYLEETERLADRISVVDAGSVIAEGTVDQLKAQVGGQRLHVVPARDADLPTAVAAVERTGVGRVDTDRNGFSVVPTSGLAEAITAVGAALSAERIEVVDFAVRRPSMDDVFLSLVGRVTTSTGGAP